MPDQESPWIKSTPTGVTINVYVAPRASINKVAGLHNKALKVTLAAPPVDGAANKALLEFLAKTFGVPRTAVSLVSGQASRNKVVQILDIGVDEAKRLLPLGA
jgi:uncharacterized protein (TIGR00251 family)